MLLSTLMQATGVSTEVCNAPKEKVEICTRDGASAQPATLFLVPAVGSQDRLKLGLKSQEAGPAQSVSRWLF